MREKSRQTTTVTGMKKGTDTRYRCLIKYGKRILWITMKMYYKTVNHPEKCEL